MKHIYALILLACSAYLQAQITQTIRGTIIDKDDQQALAGVSVAVYKNNELLKGTLTDNEGTFRLEQITVGRVTIVASYLGYKKASLPNTVVNAGKEVVLNIEMESSIEALKEVEITAVRKGETINEMAMISARGFNVEETERYAGSRGDPARMASNFAGVSGSDDSRNDIVVRGNSPFGVQYRLENVHIPNPNHFNIPGSVGGSVAILNNRMLSNSDFYTGAFPAEFGNALAGIFDIRMKKGNNERNEFTGEFGLLGANVFGEGPFSKKSKASYIFNYRYATLELLNLMGVDIGTEAIPRYTDLQFKVNAPTKNGGNVSLFGIGGYSNINLLTSSQKELTQGRDIYASGGRDEYFQSGMGVAGVNYTRLVAKNAYATITFAASTEWVNVKHSRVLRHVDSSGSKPMWVVDTIYGKLFYRFITSKLTGGFMRQYKLNARHTIRFGLLTEAWRFNLVDSNFSEFTNQWYWRVNVQRWDFMFQPYVQWKWNISDQLTFNAGLHGQIFTLNSNSWSIDPRMAFKYQFRKNQSLSLGVGLHSQMLPTYSYFITRNEYRNTGSYNQNLGFMRSFHSVIGYDLFIGNSMRIKMEAYYQQLFNIPVDTFASSYNVLNEGAGFERFFPLKLTNKGIGRNFGFEFTFEKFFTRNWFIMFTGSVYDARYRGNDGKWYNSDFNGLYNMNLLGTKEFVWQGKNKKKDIKRINTFGIGGKITFAGGKRYTPYDTVLSPISEDPVLLNSERNKQHFKPYFRFDVRINYRCNTRNITHEVGIDLVNITFQKNVLRLDYVPSTKGTQEVYQLGFLPLFYYRIDFAINGKKKSETNSN